MYSTQPTPGEAIHQADAFNIEGHPSSQHFAVIDTRVDFLEWLWLASDGHHRARFEWHEHTWQRTWLVP